VAVPKLVLRDINTGRLPAGLCPPADGTTLQSTNPTLLTGTRSTAAGSGADSEYRLHGNSGSPLPPTVPSEYGRELLITLMFQQVFKKKNFKVLGVVLVCFDIENV